MALALYFLAFLAYLAVRLFNLCNLHDSTRIGISENEWRLVFLRIAWAFFDERVWKRRISQPAQSIRAASLSLPATTTIASNFPRLLPQFCESAVCHWLRQCSSRPDFAARTHKPRDNPRPFLLPYRSTLPAPQSTEPLWLIANS
jgi:hypothetical protein